MTKEDALMGSPHARDHTAADAVDPLLLLPAEQRGRRRRRPVGMEGGVTDARSGGARHHGRFERLEGSFSLALGLSGPGLLPVEEAVGLVVADWQRQLAEDRVSGISVGQAERDVVRFAAYAARQGVVQVADITTPVCQAYCDARNARGKRGAHAETAGLPAAVSTRNARLTMLRAFFTACRLLGLDDRDPTVGVVVPPREKSRAFRPLTDAEYALCQRRSRKSAQETRLPAAVALAGRGATTAELPAIRVRDLHLDAAKVWLHGGGTRTQARWADLDPWCVEVLTRRVDDLARTRPPELLQDTLLVYAPLGRDVIANHRQSAASTTMLTVLQHAGLDRKPGVRPMSFVDRAAVVAWEETGRLEAVAARLGMRSLDAVADMLRRDWRAEFRVAGPVGVADPTDAPTYAGVAPVRPRPAVSRIPPKDVRAPAVRLVHGSRSRKQSERDITTTTMRLRAVAEDPATYLASLAIPVRPPRTPGKPGHYPHWAYTVFNSLIGPNGSARTVAKDLEDEKTWQMFVDGAREHLGEHAVEGIRRTGPTRHHWNTWASTYGAHNVAPLGEAFRALALAQAAGQGLLDPDAPGTTARPHRGTLVAGDGKVMSAPCRNRLPFRVDKRTGERIPQRVDPASDDWKEGGTTDDGKDRWEFGSKFVCLSARDDDYYARVVLDIEHLPHVNAHGGEAGLAVDMLLRLKHAAGDGMTAAVWDGALSGVHIDKLMRAGLLVVSPVTPAKNPDGERAAKAGGSKKETRRVEKSAPLDLYDGGHGCPGHDLWAIGGQVHERHQLVDGTDHDQPLAHRLLKPRGKDGQSRWYHEVRIPCGEHVVHTTQVAVYRTAEDAHRGRKGNDGFNRSEYLRQLPPGTDDYEHSYRTRNDAESLNSQLESMHYFNRLPAYGAERQTLVMLGAVMSENSVSRYHHARRQAQAAAAA